MFKSCVRSRPAAEGKRLDAPTPTSKGIAIGWAMVCHSHGHITALPRCTMIQAFFRLSHHPPGGKGEEIGIGKEIFIFSQKMVGILRNLIYLHLVGKYTTDGSFGNPAKFQKPTKFYQLEKIKRPPGPFLIPASAVVYYQTFSYTFQKNAC